VDKKCYRDKTRRCTGDCVAHEEILGPSLSKPTNCRIVNAKATSAEARRKKADALEKK
jgi:hypothetical protein